MTGQLLRWQNWTAFHLLLYKLSNPVLNPVLNTDTEIFISVSLPKLFFGMQRINIIYSGSSLEDPISHAHAIIMTPVYGEAVS